MSGEDPKTVEISGCTFQVAGMLSRYARCDLIRKCYRDFKGEDCPDLPIVIEKFMPRHTATILGKHCMLIGPLDFVSGEVDFLHLYPFAALPTQLHIGP